MKKIAIEREWGILLTIALVALSYSFYLAVAFAGQPPLDVHSFRQTQTALTSYWFIKQGFQLAYETPVAGAPWGIPFEFPIYQAIVAYFSKTLNWGLDGTGRLVSYAFLLLTIIPAIGIAKRLKLPGVTSLYFIAILFSMPIYVYWGRSFMIETAALFFCIAAIKLFLDYLLGERTILVALAFIAFASLGVLQKATTALPILVVLSIVFFAVEFKRSDSLKSVALIKNLFVAGVIFLIPIAIGFAWVNFTDQVKLENPLGEQLTSAALGKWNWGTLSQRTSSEIWTKVVWERVLSPNLGALLGILLLITPFLVRAESKIKYIMLAVISLGIIPLFLFTNLHLVHDYYQTANALFFAYGVSLALAAVVAPALGKRVAIFILVMLMLSNYVALHNGYLPQIKNEFTKANRDLAIGKMLNREVPDGMQFVAFGNDWSSTFAYISERKSFTVPGWFKGYDQAISNPAEFLEQGRLGAIVSCTTQKPSVIQVFDWAKNNGSWKVGETHGCFIVTPEKQISDHLLDPAQCLGSIDRADVELRDGREFVVFAGWLAADNDNKRIPDDVVLKISNKDAAPIYLQALKVPRLDANQYLRIHGDIDAGFSRIIENTFKTGIYEVELVQGTGGKFRSCGVRKTFEIR
ncbi:glycosyltransferase family 39 protein [Comamonas aquatica]|uniref:ArnT family glycosyltransferase n=1 Tax=Comamonas aquatica TaxID=225991 RepID=UPI002447FF63|nr:hypothetical protein [Comamonas aquatica]MDH1380713.1 glycosyltransferase family 39 protein [Comamonas aquatica]MDH1640633.1 glycosyltransferase family 39 protein [Comamonas aquatica]